jgi:hypothetical protein
MEFRSTPLAVIPVTKSVSGCPEFLVPRMHGLQKYKELKWLDGSNITGIII